jgi:hypothetical protein
VLRADADEGLAGAGQCLAERLDDGQIGGRRAFAELRAALVTLG